MSVTDTAPKLLRYNYEKYGDKKVAMRKKQFGVWKEYTWKDCYVHVKYLSLGLISLGLKRGDRVSIIGDNDPQWFWAQWATQAVGGIAVGLFVDSLPSEIKHIVEHSESKFVLAKDQEQVDKFLRLREDLSRVSYIIYWADKGMLKYDEPILKDWLEVENLGKEYDECHPGFFEDEVEKGQTDDYANIVYTSGTSGEPKGAIHTHRTMLANGTAGLTMYPYSTDDDYVSYWPPAWIAEQAIGITQCLLSGNIRINFPEEPETVAQNIREIGPRFVGFGPRLWEGMASVVQSKMLDANVINRLVYSLALPIGYKMVDLQLAEKSIPVFWRSLYRLAHWAVFRPLRDRLGLLKVRFAITGGGPLSPDCFRFFRAIGVPLSQLMGLSELGAVSGHQNNEFDLDSIGRPAPGAEVRISADNEILARGEGLFLGYYKNPELTEKARGDGWLHTGDGGYIDERGLLIYWDRLTDLFELASGTKFAPQYIEGKLKFSPYIRDCMVLGGKDKDFVAAIVAIDFDICGRWAESNHISYTTFVDLCQKSEIIELIKKDIARVNRTLPEAQGVRKFINLYKEFDADEAELTRTRKLRRGFMEERYRGIVEAIYTGEDQYNIEAPIVYRDGRTGVVRTTIKVNSVG